MKKLLLLISLLTNIFANNELGKDVLEEYGDVTYICKDNLVIALINIDNRIKEVPVVWEQGNNVVKLNCDDFEEWVK